MARGFKAANPFKLLEEEFKDKVAASNTDELRNLIAETCKNEEQNLAAMKADQDLKSKKALVSEAAAGYREGTKRNKQKLKFIIQVLSDRGDEQAQSIVQLTLAGA
jgi:hypothetical protein